MDELTVSNSTIEIDSTTNVPLNNDILNTSSPFNMSFDDNEDYIFDNSYVRIIFLSLYSVVFCLCFFGNLLVILVVTLSRRIRSITNFFLANLAVADFCVAVFCVYQNFVMYLIQSWAMGVLGNFLCKMYMFIQSLSNTASVFILVVICAERYFAIIYPFTCKRMLTPKRLKLVILCVWIKCILYSSPKLYYANAVPHQVLNKTETICINNREKYNSKVFDIIHFVLLYCIPLAIMSLLYTRIAVCLWDSSEQLKKQLNASSSNNQLEALNRKPSNRYKLVQDKKFLNGDENLLQSGGTSSTAAAAAANNMPNPHSSQNVLRARRGVIKMLIIVVFAFAICHLPYHARKLWQYWSPHYHGQTNFSAILTPVTFLCTYFNSGINPLLYAFLSKNFRRGMREILLCSYRRKRMPNNRNHMSLHVALHRQASTRSTIKANNTTVTILNNEASSECSHEV